MAREQALDEVVPLIMELDAQELERADLHALHDAHQLRHLPWRRLHGPGAETFVCALRVQAKLAQLVMRLRVNCALCLHH